MQGTPKYGDLFYKMVNNNNLSTSPKENINRIRRQIEVCRGIALDVLTAVSQRKPADRELAKILRSRKELGARDRRLVSDLIFALFRWWGWTRIWENTDLDRMLLASMALEGRMDSTVAAEWVRKVKPSGNWPKDDEKLSLKKKGLLLGEFLGPVNHKRFPRELLPDWFFDERYFPFGEFDEKNSILDSFLSILQTRPPIWIRFQEKDGKKVIKELQDAGVRLHLHAKLKTTASIHSKININTIPCYRDGKFEIQDFSSQMVAPACAPQPGESWWDVCAGGGGKTLHLAALMKGRGEIWATDVRKSALAELKRRIKKTKLKNISTQLLKQGLNDFEGSEVGTVEKLFDGILVDAPCSGMGTWRRNPDARWRMDRDDVDRLSKIQFSLLNDCANRVRSGGTLVYSVCSLVRAETLGVIEPFLETHPTFQLSPIEPVQSIEGSTGNWIWPQTHNSDGMFIVRLQRKR